MVKACSIKNCKSEWKKTEDVTFHRFPIEPESREKFIAAIPLKLQPKVTKYTVICSIHFTAESFQPQTSTSVRRRLKSEAIPTLFDCDNEAGKYKSLTSSTGVIVNEEEPSTSNIDMVLHTEELSASDMVLYKEKLPNDDLSQVRMEKSDSIIKKDVAVQTSDKCFPPEKGVVDLRKKLTILQKRLRRREIRLKTMNNIMQHLKQNSISTHSVEEELHNHFSGFKLDIMRNEMQNSCIPKGGKRYSEQMKNFAATLYFYSPKAYNFIRTKLNLPHDSLLRKWLNS